MHIFCPKCHMGYEVDESLIPEEGRRLRCSNCLEVFKFDRSGMSESVLSSVATEENDDVKRGASTEPLLADKLKNEIEKDLQDAVLQEMPEINIKEVFERLAEQSEKLFQEEKKLPWHKRLLLQLKTMLGLNRRFNFKFITFVGTTVLLIFMYNYRYEIVRTAPFMNGVYRMLGIRAKIPGEGLEFQNVNWNYRDVNGGRILEIKGFISNPTKKDIDIPVVHVELLDEETILLQSINQKPTVQTLKPDGRLAIGVIIKTPSPTAKYVYLSFIDAY